MSSVFVGKVTHIDHHVIGEGDTADFQREQMLRGDVPDLVKVRVETAVCSPWVFSDPFKEGYRYVVYATKDSRDGVLQVNSCSRVASIDEDTSESKQDANYWSGIAAMKGSSIVFGTVKRYTGEKKSHGFHELDEEKVFNVEPVLGEEVRVAGEGKKMSTRTDESGRYELRDLQPGHYTVSVHNPARPLLDTQREIDLWPKGCAEVDFRKTADGETVFDDSVRSAEPPSVGR